MLSHALTLLAQGHSVIPVAGNGSKRPIVPWQEYQTRRPTTSEVEAWWAAHPDAWVGVVTGAVSGLVVVDIDGHVDHPEDFAKAHGLAPTRAVRTPSGGCHYYYQHPGTPVQNAVRATTLGGCQVDIRGDGGYVVAPPSPGYRESWGGASEPQPYRAPRPPAPAATNWEQEVLRAGVEELFLPAPEGQRNHAAARLAGYLLKTCTDPQAAYAQLAAWNTRNMPPLPEHELQRTFQSIASRAARTQVIEATPPPVVQFDWLEGEGWAHAVANQPERNGQVFQSVPLSELHRGYCPGDLVTLVARPGTGKSALMCGAMLEASFGHGESAFLFSGDMAPADIANWMTRIHYGVDRPDPQQWARMLGLIRDSRLAIKHSGIIDVGRVRFMLEHRPETRYVFIDHFNKVATAGATRVADLKQVAAQLKDLAGAHGVTMFVLSQVNREGEGKSQLTRANVAESDALVQESDVIYGLTLVGDVQQQDPNTATVTLTLIKNRFGQDGVDQVAYFHKNTRAFEWLSRGIPWGQIR